MIRNIVFDMGKVLVDYSGMPVCRHFTDNEALAKRVCTAVFDSPEWVLLDMGVITEEDGIKKMISRLDTEEEKELENMELGLSDEEFQVIKARALNGVIERIRLHQQNEKSCYL